jgi:hypothetical protein
MVWSTWKSAAVLAGLGSVSLICASLVCGQQPAARPDAAQIVTIQEAGKPPMECIILKSYRRADGQLAHDVRVLSSGETMTFIDGNLPDAKGQPPMGWTKGKAGAPREYIEEHFVSGPDTVPGGKIQPVAATKGPDEFRTIQEAGKAAQKCRVMARWKTPEGSPACQLQAVDTGEILTILEVGPAQTTQGPAKAVATKIYHWGKNTTPPSGVPVPPPVQEAIAATPPINPGNSTCAPQMSVEQAKPSIGERVKDAVSNLLPGRSTSPVTLAQASPRPPDAPRTVDMPPSPVTLKDDGLKQWAKGDSGINSFGKPSVDAAAPLSVDPKSPVQLANPGSAAPPLPLVPAALASGDAKLPTVPTPVLPPIASTKTSLPAGPTLPGSKIDSSRDPLAAPEKFAGLPSKTFGDSAWAGSDSSQLPPGASSVMAAANGTTPPIMPVPMVTMPQARPPMPPAADLPKPPTQAPNPTWYANAFTPPLPPNAVSEQMLMAQQQQQQQMQMMAMMQAGYPVPMGYAPMPYGQAAMMMPGRGMVPMGYQGPAPPNPTGGMPMMPQGYPVMMPMMPAMPMQPMGFANPAMDRPGMPMNSSMTLQQKISILQTSIYPTTREEAVISLCEGEYRGHPQVVQLLMRVAKDDPAPTVRAACVAGLMRMNVTGDSMLQTLTTLKTDSDPRVRRAVDEAMVRLSPSAVQQTGARQ